MQRALAKGIDFVFERSKLPPPVVYADEKRLRQMLINLLSNAIKFAQAGSARFVAHYRDPVAEFEVTDTGLARSGRLSAQAALVTADDEIEIARQDLDIELVLADVDPGNPY